MKERSMTCVRCIVVAAIAGSFPTSDTAARGDDGVGTALEIKAEAMQNMISASGDASLRRFIDEHVSEAYLRSITPDALMDRLKRIRSFCARAGVMIIVPQGDDGLRLTCEVGNTAYAVDFHVASTPPHAITSLEMTKVDSPLRRAEIKPITWANLAQRLDEEENTGFSGAVVIVRNGKVVSDKGYGQADRERGVVNTSDTPENQEAYPQNPQQKKGLGFPIARVAVLLSLASGMLTGMAVGPYAGKETGESALLRSLLGSIDRDDIVPADRHYCSYFMIALLQERGIDLVARLHQRRPVDFRRGRRLSKDDQVITWDRPQRPAWMDQQTYNRVPASIEVRAIRVHVGQPGYRVESFVAVTTLTDAKEYPKEDIASLYQSRRLAELDIRAIKITMGMDNLRCKTPEMVRKEMWTCLLAYNLIRRAMLQSAQEAGVSPRTLSFTAAVPTIGANWLVMVLGDDTWTSRLVDAALTAIAVHVVGNRPGRVDPARSNTGPRNMPYSPSHALKRAPNY